MDFETVNKALKSLEQQGLMRQTEDGKWEPTALGRAAVILEDEADRVRVCCICGKYPAKGDTRYCGGDRGCPHGRS